MYRKLVSLVIRVAAVALLVQTLAPAGEPQPDGPSARQILDRMAKAYAECKTYRDSGVVTTVFFQDTGKRTVERPFTTAFERPDLFRFEYKDQGRRYLIWSDGKTVKTWWDVKPGAQEPESLRMALGGATGVSGGSAARIPSMLMPDKLKGWGTILVSEAKRIEDGRLEKVACYRVKGKYVKNPVTLWIAKDSYLVWRVDQQMKVKKFRVETTTTYDPVINEKVPDKMLAFDPPVQE